MVTITIQRNRKDEACIQGLLFLNEIDIGVTLENVFYAIPAGIYKGEIRFSPHFNRLMIHFVYDDGTYMIHWGNVPKNYKGCVGVGKQVDPATKDFIDDTVAEHLKLWTCVLTDLITDPDLTIQINENFS